MAIAITQRTGGGYTVVDGAVTELHGALNYKRTRDSSGTDGMVLLNTAGQKETAVYAFGDWTVQGTSGYTTLVEVADALDAIGLSRSVSASSGSTLPGHLDLAIREIKATYGDTVSVYDKNKSLIKFGENATMGSGTQETIWGLTDAHETYLAANSIDSIISSAADTVDMVVEGHTISGSDFTFVTQTATLTGVVRVVLATPLARVSRIYNVGATDLAGDVTVYINAGDDYITANGSNQSAKCATTLSSVDYWLITSVVVSVKAGNNAVVDFELQIRDSGGVFRTVFTTSAGVGSGAVQVAFEEPIIVPPNSDVRMVGTSDTATTKADASIHGQLAIIV